MDTANNNLIQQGRLRVNVFSGRRSTPVEGATVSITPRVAEGRIVEQMMTDMSGQTDTVNLAAPPLEYSMAVDQPKPYSEYDLTITANGFDTVKINGVQILPDTDAIQNVMLVDNRGNTDRAFSITIKDNTLWGTFDPKTPEEEVKPLPPSKGYVVLPKPVIPEFIVVHAGVPSNSSAPNYWIPFKDYIKNVASCEIYATWPDSTIAANVLAILSFTLNRVYTEWYRGKGYNFTITNSTAYDHAFSYGRNIFSRISQAVDGIFTSFITRPNIRQPLLTQYCDGQQVQCPNWMTQWGSKHLGDQGYNTMDILKNFYGYDIFLMQATEVEGVPSSFPGTVLQVGSTGSNVRTIQTQLNAISNNYPAIPKIRVDGIYGQQTLNAVETFQEIFGLNSSGLVDFATWYKISDIYVAVSRLAELR